jgi:hypothetical protein
MRQLALVGVIVVTWSCGGLAQERAVGTSFSEKVQELSEPGGFFDTDNLISNERSYLHVMDALVRFDVAGGAYIGVGPDQNFSYIAQIQPRVAYMVDIRRDNMVMHLMFKAIFELAPTRVEFLSILVARAPPPDQTGWSDWTIDELTIYFDSASTNSRVAERARATVDSAVTSFGVALSEDDWRNLDRFHKTFMRDGLSLRFTSHGRSPQFYYPTYRDLLLERSMSGERTNYLTSSVRYQVVRDLQVADRIIPVVGDLAGEYALQAIGRDVKARGLAVSGFYASNVEFYLFGSRTFEKFVQNVRALPIDEHSVMIRSVFRNPYGGHPLTVPGYGSTQMLGPIEDLLRLADDGTIRSYWDLVTHYIEN